MGYGRTLTFQRSVAIRIMILESMASHSIPLTDSDE